MAEKFQIAYIPIGVPTFELVSAEACFHASAALIEKLAGEKAEVKVPEKMLLSIAALDGFLDGIDPDLMIVQNITFANAAYISEVLHRHSAPVVLWAVREPVIDGGRLRLNSLTGSFSAANTLKQFRNEPVQFVFGAPQEEKLAEKLGAVIRAAALKKKLAQSRMLVAGHTPEGFGFGRALDADMLHTFGVRLTSIEARELINAAKGYTDEEAREYLEKAEKISCGLDAIPEKNRLDFARLYRAYDIYVKEHDIQMLASRCWPDFFVDFGTPVCMVLAMMNDIGVSASCETDAYGALSMFMGQELSGKPAFFGDPVSMDEKENTITFWHCGTAACSLAREDTGAAVGVHCNRKIGPTLDFGCKASDHATIFRVSRAADGSFRFFIETGKVLDRPKQFTGTSLVVETDGNAEQIIEQGVEAGMEPHFAVIYGDVSRELKALAKMLNIPVM